MFRRLLAGTDLTPASDAVLSCLGQLKPLGLEEVILTHVVYVAHSVGLAETLTEQAEPELARQKELLESQGLRVRAEVMTGIPAHKLADRADEEEVSALISGRTAGVYCMGSWPAVSAWGCSGSRRSRCCWCASR